MFVHPRCIYLNHVYKKTAQSDYELIRNAIAIFPLAVDSKNYDLLSEGFAPNVVVEYPEPIGVTRGVKDLQQALEHVLKGLETHHALSTQSIKQTSQTSADGTTYCMAVHFGTGKATGRQVTGWSHSQDTLEKGIFDNQEGWRITKRKVHFHVPHSADGSLLGIKEN
ncbi:uncharacterized protein BDZ83DRAFT_636688 [Colletotrichum acutatum]|uniref:SnoaL-like domain-containing protein n=1 Tax=Glomerella acutata TaxID=27357 RepID=A0AAD8X9X1_GLOAC|nr:uncharacterized protein BDZ83DRAFT_636688 [Colletotrichum acutatum]KAK1714118.1 hypothetical protein BDZ83DRAFT_636688 [Colletotrichum acutatum]